MNDIYDFNESPLSEDDNDLVELPISYMLPEEGTLKIEIVEGESYVKLWDYATKNTDFSTSKTWELGSDTIPESVFIEGIQETPKADDVKIKLSYIKDGEEKAFDEIIVEVINLSMSPETNYYIGSLESEDLIKDAAVTKNPKNVVGKNSNTMTTFFEPVVYKGLTVESYSLPYIVMLRHKFEINRGKRSIFKEETDVKDRTWDSDFPGDLVRSPENSLTVIDQSINTFEWLQALLGFDFSSQIEGLKELKVVVNEKIANEKDKRQLGLAFHFNPGKRNVSVFANLRNEKYTGKEIANYTILTHSVEIEEFNAVRRKYGNDDGESTKIRIKASINFQLTLKIEKLENNSKGDVSFSNEKKKIEYTGKGTDSWDEIELIGIKESTKKDDFRIVALNGDKIIAENIFIIYSESVIDFESDLTQHKDTNASCIHCAMQGGVSPKHRHHAVAPDYKETEKPCSHDSYLNYCVHCNAMCARCCLKILKGGNQDDYLHRRTITVEENHGVNLDSKDIKRYGFKVVMPTYKSLYNRMKTNIKFIYSDQDLNAEHVFVAHGCRKNNKETGEIHKDWQLYVWDPLPPGTGRPKQKWIDANKKDYYHVPK